MARRWRFRHVDEPIVTRDVGAPAKEWSFLTNHARVLLCVAQDPEIRLRDIANSLGITERTVHGILTDLANAGYVMKERDGRRNRYEIKHHLPLPEASGGRRTIGDLLALLVETDSASGRRNRRPAGRGS